MSVGLTICIAQSNSFERHIKGKNKVLLHGVVQKSGRGLLMSILQLEVTNAAE